MFRRKSRTSSAPQSNLVETSMNLRKKYPRSHSAPMAERNASHRVKGIMKTLTVDDSLHSTYGTEKDSESDPSQQRKSIEFKDIFIREFARTVGDNPSCSNGPPISISWEYNPDTQIISVDQYEESRPQRRTYFEMILPRSVRQQMLRKDWDVTQAQIAAAVRQNIKVKNQRRATVNNLGKTTKMEEMMERASKGIMKGLLLKNSTKKEVEKLEKQLDEAEKLRKQQTMVHSMKDEVNEVSVDEDEVDAEELDDEQIEEYPEEEEEEESSETQDEDGENKSPTHQEKAPIE